MYKANKLRARTFTKTPTATDQAGARETDINVIVGRMLPTGTVPGLKTQPVYADWTRFPDTLQEMINQARSIEKHLGDLPPWLENLAIQDLMALTPEQLHSIIDKHLTEVHKPKQPPAPPQET